MDDPLAIPTLVDVLEAQRVIRPYLPPTPFQQSEELSRRLGAEIWVKYENLQPIRAFKVRGGINLVSRLSPAERSRGLITASTGNHGQSIAYAGRLFGAPVVVAVPERANPLKVAAMRALGAEVVETGPDFDAARAWAERTATERGLRYVHTANEPRLIAGVATMSLEMLEQVPDLEVIISPIGGGSGACGHCIAGKGLNPRLQVIGVQAEGAPALWRAYHQGITEPIARIETFAEGLAARTPFELPVRILRERLDDLILVSDAEIRAAMVALIETTRTLAEGAGAASTAAAFKLAERLQGKRVGLVLSGANVTVAGLREALTAEAG
jgi:threonine dehydratase